jgi:ferredoxin
MEQDIIMKLSIFYYTGTGNSLWVARTLAKLAGEADIISISAWLKEKKPVPSSVIGIIFPVHMWGVPGPVIRFISEIKSLSPEYLFAITANSGQVANTLLQLRNLLKKQGFDLSCGYEIKMPSNYIPWGGAESKEKQEQKFELARRKLSTIFSVVNDRGIAPVERGPLWQRLLLTLVYKLSFSQVPKMDAKYWVDEKCNHCGICSRICPADNIKMIEGKPIWNHHCEQCMACIQWCPERAIQYGKKTPQYARYHQPEIDLQDVLKGKSLGDGS